jgi:hypothetical protein
MFLPRRKRDRGLENVGGLDTEKLRPFVIAKVL